MSDDHNNVVQLRRATQREWAIAKYVVIGGFVVAAGLLAYFALRPTQQAAPQTASIPANAVSIKPHAASQADADSQAGMMLCAQELLAAKSIGIVPDSGQLARLQPYGTKTNARFACIAATSVTQYVIEADLRCRTLNDPKCVRLYNVRSGDGMVLYQRQKD
ncbi:MAG TPA: hypothetical protein VGG48_07220 [Rhizomicrobium sp.]|jgi:hypothetical protein